MWSLAKLQASPECMPRLTFNTGHPVWRARDLPFGKGILSLPQRGDALLEMWSYDDLRSPVETFEGHTDVVKEFVWRTHATGDGERTEFSGRANLKVNQRGTYNSSRGQKTRHCGSGPSDGKCFRY